MLLQGLVTCAWPREPSPRPELAHAAVHAQVDELAQRLGVCLAREEGRDKKLEALERRIKSAETMLKLQTVRLDLDEEWWGERDDMIVLRLARLERAGDKTRKTRAEKGAEIPSRAP